MAAKPPCDHVQTVRKTVYTRGGPPNYTFERAGERCERCGTVLWRPGYEPTA